MECVTKRLTTTMSVCLFMLAAGVSWAQQPTTTTETRRFQVVSVDGNSVIIGGLLSEEKTHDTAKVPLLGDIPLLGYLFQHQSIQTRKTDLVIEVTPHIVPEQQ